MKRKHAALLAAAAAVAALGLAWLLSSDESSGAATVAGSARSGAQAHAAGPGLAAGAADTRAMPRPYGAEPGDSFLTSDLRFKLEEILLEAGDAANPAELKRRLAALVGKHFSAAEATRALALLERYVDYRVALGEIKPPADATDPRALRGAIDARLRVRQKHFSPEEYQALFAQDEELDRFTLARMEIERNTELTPAQKQAALREAERELSDAHRAQRAEAVAHVAVAAQTAAFDAKGASEQERYAQRRAQYGDAAAQQLAQLDREESDWQARLNEYAAAKARSAPAEQLQQLKQQLFSAQEQLRIEAALTLRKQ